MFIKFSGNAKSSLYILFLIMLLSPNNSNNSIEHHKENKLSQLKNEFNQFLKIYSSNACIMEVFLDFNKNCEEMTDRLNSTIAYRMTVCLYSSIGKNIPTCLDGEKTDCIKLLEGDQWTTYITFSHHVDNLCFYYKTLVWEKSSEFILMKLFNASAGILSEISQSQTLTEKMMSTHIELSRKLENNLLDTLDSFHKFNQFFENFTQTEEKMKVNIALLEDKININSEKVSSITSYVDNKLEYIGHIYEFFYSQERKSDSVVFYGFILIFTYVSTTFKSTKGLRVFLILLVIGLFFFEKILAESICKYYCSQILLIGGMCCDLIFYLIRTIFFIALLITLVYRCYQYKKPRRPSDFSWTDYKSYLNMTPMWMKKYFTKLKSQNEELKSKFKKIKEMLAEERKIIQEEKEQSE